MGLALSVGTLHQTIHEASAAVAPAEDERVRAVLESDLLHADETPWPEARQTLWLWTFVAATATLYYVAGRGKELVENVLDGFTGWLMSDGHPPPRCRGRAASAITLALSHARYERRLERLVGPQQC